ncbi:unnamed protein product [Amoebophrya sp. A120]|nr:unnamed protein product [Amoebophrya sp. A120]|eukprot:GSA120T00019824001.1
MQPSHRNMCMDSSSSSAELPATAAASSWAKTGAKAILLGGVFLICFAGNFFDFIHLQGDFSSEQSTLDEIEGGSLRLLTSNVTVTTTTTTTSTTTLVAGGLGAQVAITETLLTTTTPRPVYESTVSVEEKTTGATTLVFWLVFWTIVLVLIVVYFTYFAGKNSLAHQWLQKKREKNVHHRAREHHEDIHAAMSDPDDWSHLAPGPGSATAAGAASSSRGSSREKKVSSTSGKQLQLEAGPAQPLSLEWDGGDASYYENYPSPPPAIVGAATNKSKGGKDQRRSSAGKGSNSSKKGIIKGKGKESEHHDEQPAPSQAQLALEWGAGGEDSGQQKHGPPAAHQHNGADHHVDHHPKAGHETKGKAGHQPAGSGSKGKAQEGAGKKSKGHLPAAHSQAEVLGKPSQWDQW